MKFYWLLKQVPELHGLSPAERRRVHGACLCETFKSLRCTFALFVCGLCGGAGFFVGYLPYLVFGAPLSTWLPTLGAFIGGGIGCFIFDHTMLSYLRPFYAEYIKRELRRDVSYTHHK